jgi:hypothetical protein
MVKIFWWIFSSTLYCSVITKWPAHGGFLDITLATAWYDIAHHIVIAIIWWLITYCLLSPKEAETPKTQVHGAVSLYGIKLK